MLTELKDRAKVCISAKNLPEAVKLYSKGIEIADRLTAAEKAILFANRSMVQLQMGIVEPALTDAEEAISTDSSYIKGYYRKAMVLVAKKNYNGAKDALSQGLLMKPDDKDFLTQLKKVEGLITTSRDSKPASSKPVEKSPTVPSAPKTQPVSKQPKVDASNASNDDDDENLGNIRGYKKTADGRITTFFNNDLDEKTKQLIGDIAPKKVDQTVFTAATPSVGSAWNSAGTYEEKNTTDWASDNIRQILLETAVSSGQLSTVVDGKEVLYDVAVTIKSVEKVEGDAQVTIARGKKKHFCDFNIDTKWNLHCKTAGDNSFDIEGTINIADMTADDEFEIISVTVGSTPSDMTILSKSEDLLSAAQAKNFTTFLVTKHIRSSSGVSISKAIGDSIGAFCTKFKATF